MGPLNDQLGQDRSLEMWARSVSSSRAAVGRTRGFPEWEGKSPGHFDGGVTRPGCYGGNRMQAGQRGGHGSE